MNMAEDPATWGEAEKIVQRALREAAQARQQQLAGFSTPRRVADALRDAGLLAGDSDSDDWKLAYATLQGQIRDLLVKWLDDAAKMIAFGSLDDERYAHRIEKMIMEAQRELLLK